MWNNAYFVKVSLTKTKSLCSLGRGCCSGSFGGGFSDGLQVSYDMPLLKILIMFSMDYFVSTVYSFVTAYNKVKHMRNCSLPVLHKDTQKEREL